MPNIALLQAFQAPYVRSDIPQNIDTGMEIIAHFRIKEGAKERIQKVQGIVLKRAGKTPMDVMITLLQSGAGFFKEIVFPLNGPSIAKIEYLRTKKTRRANMRYLKNLFGKSARLRDATVNFVPKYITQAIQEPLVMHDTNPKEMPSDAE
jgi:large subunit ribosomal protein L19